MPELSPIQSSPIMPSSSKEEGKIPLNTPVRLGELHRTTTDRTPPTSIQYPALVDGEMLPKNIELDPEKVKNDLSKMFQGEKPSLDGVLSLYLHVGVLGLLKPD